MTDETIYTTMPSPVGELTLTATEEGLTGVMFEIQRHGPTSHERSGWRKDDGKSGRASEVLAAARAQMYEYFAGERTAFELPLAPRGTPFQQKVWLALREIPYGEKVAYGDIARRIGAPRAVRAVGAANGRNPLPIVVPCHRVIGASGALTGFGGGIERKLWLLERESATLPLTGAAS